MFDESVQDSEADPWAGLWNDNWTVFNVTVTSGHDNAFPRHSIWGERCIEHIYVALPVSAAFCRISNLWAFSHKDAHIKDNVTGADRTGRAHRFISCAGEDGAAAGWLVDPTQKRRAREHFSRTCGLGLKTNNHPVMSPRGRPASQNISLMWQIFHVTYEGIIWRCR